MRGRGACALFAAITLSPGFAASAQEYLGRPIRLIVAKLRALAGSGPRRSLALPDMPTAVEAGLPGYVVTSWFGILAPARTPAELIAKLNAALNKVMRERDMQDKIASEGAEPAPSRPDEFGKLIASELAVWAKVIKAAGL